MIGFLGGVHSCQWNVTFILVAICAIFYTFIVGWLLDPYILVTYKVISGTKLSQLYSAAPVGNHATKIMTWYSTLSPYSDTKPID